MINAALMTHLKSHIFSPANVMLRMCASRLLLHTLFLVLVLRGALIWRLVGYTAEPAAAIILALSVAQVINACILIGKLVSLPPPFVWSPTWATAFAIALMVETGLLSSGEMIACVSKNADLNRLCDPTTPLGGMSSYVMATVMLLAVAIVVSALRYALLYVAGQMLLLCGKWALTAVFYAEIE